MTTFRERGPATREARPRERVVDRRSWVPTAGPGMVIGLLAGAAVVVSLFLPWREGPVEPADIPISFLWDRDTASHHPSFLFLLIPLAALVLVGAAVPRGAGVRLLGGIGTAVVVGLFAFQAYRLVDDIPGGNFGATLESGFYVAAIGAVLGLVSGFAPAGWTRRRSVDRYDQTDIEP